MIISSGNQQIRNIMQLQRAGRVRRKQRVFVAEGPRMVSEAPKEWVERLYVSESYRERAGEPSGYPCRAEIVSDAVFGAVSDTCTPQGILALLRMPEYRLEDLLGHRGKPLLLILDTIQDPGNLGMMLRTGEGAGVSGVLMNRATADIFSPKAIRATMGSIYRVPFVVTEDLEGGIRWLKGQGIVFYAACLEGERHYDEADYSGGCGFLIGNEGNGLAREVASLADFPIRIPMAGQVESLNAAMAAGILMYEAARQRRRI